MDCIGVNRITYHIFGPTGWQRKHIRLEKQKVGTIEPGPVTGL